MLICKASIWLITLSELNGHCYHLNIYENKSTWNKNGYLLTTGKMISPTIILPQLLIGYLFKSTLIVFMLKTTTKNKHCSLSIKEVLKKSNSENKFLTFYQGIDTYFWYMSIHLMKLFLVRCARNRCLFIT
jgi:hypothetical protein